jgi:hypothetical protein
MVEGQAPSLAEVVQGYRGSAPHEKICRVLNGMHYFAHAQASESDPVRFLVQCGKMASLQAELRRLLQAQLYN